jgi:transcriptional regulator with XRE-family HTH domain
MAISQEELAWRSDMHRTYLADVERGVRNLSLSSMARLIRGIGVPMSEFFETFESLDVPTQNGNGQRRKSRAGNGSRSSRR